MNPFESYEGPSAAPTGCDPIVLPAPTNPNCPNDYNAHESEITDVWISPAELQEDGTYLPTAPPTNWESFADLNATADLRHLTVIGDKPLGEGKTVTLAKKWFKVVDRSHTANMDVTDMSEANYEFIRTLQHGSKVFIWWKSYGDWVCGGENGILCDVNAAGIIWGRGDGTLMTGQMVFSWSNQYDPPAKIGNSTPSPLRVVKPRKPMGGGGSTTPLTEIPVVTGGDVTGIESQAESAKTSRKKDAEAEDKKAA